MVKSNVEREEERRRVGDAVEDRKTDASTEGQSTGSKAENSMTDNPQNQVSAVETLKPDDGEETSESPSKKVRFEDEHMEVDSGQDMNADDKMLCQAEIILNSAESEDLERLREALISLGHAGNRDVVRGIYPPPRITA